MIYFLYNENFYKFYMKSKKVVLNRQPSLSRHSFLYDMELVYGEKWGNEEYIKFNILMNGEKTIMNVPEHMVDEYLRNIRYFLQKGSDPCKCFEKKEDKGIEAVISVFGNYDYYDYSYMMRHHWNCKFDLSNSYKIMKAYGIVLCTVMDKFPSHIKKHIFTNYFRKK